MLKRLGFIMAIAMMCGGFYLYFAYTGSLGQLEMPGGVSSEPRSPARVMAEDDAQARAAIAVGNEDESQILFGDLHVHTTYSMDAFLTSLPVMQGEGAHPPADACDFARYCSALDFYSINDHAEGLTSGKWNEIRESVRQCNAIGDPAAEFLGFSQPQPHIGLLCCDVEATTELDPRNVALSDLFDHLAAV